MNNSYKRIQSKDTLKEWLLYELCFYKCEKIQRLIPISEKAILRRHQILLRKTEYHTNCKHRIRAVIYKLKLLSVQNRYSIHIPINCCGKGLHIVHLGPIIINSKAIIGEDCSLHINTAIVADGISNSAPVLGNGIVVGIGAVILGEIKIADNIAIGANAVVNKSFIEKTITLAGVPAKKIGEGGSLLWDNKEMA